MGLEVGTGKKAVKRKWKIHMRWVWWGLEVWLLK